MRRAIAIGVALGLCLAPASAQAFDTGPHADMTRDALTAEGFGAAGANVGMVNNGSSTTTRTPTTTRTRGTPTP
jgi:hypothetical protein